MQQNTPSSSRCEITQILPYHTINGADRLLGGYMLTCIDEVAAASARRFCRKAVTTALMDQVEFIAPAKLGELFSATGVVTRAGRTSVEVKVTGYVENDDGSRRLICRAYVVLVCLDENGKPSPVPQLVCETDEERYELALAEERDAARRERREKARASEQNI